MRRWAGIALRGACMGLSDAVPGVSGGTMALVLGIYARLVDAVSGIGGAMLRRMRTRRFWSRVREELRRPPGRAPAALADDPDGADAGRVLLLASLVVGLVPALVGGSATLPSLLSLYPAQMKALFLGLVLGSVTIPAREIGRWRPVLGALAVGAAVSTAWFVGLPERTTGNARGTVTLHFAGPVAEEALLTPRNVALTVPGADGVEVVYGPASTTTVPAGAASAQLDVVARMAGVAGNAAPGSVHDVAQSPVEVASVSQPEAMRGGRDPSLAFVFLAGVLAISAMTLPGVSGAFVLLLLGLYHYATHALKATLTGGDPGSALVVATLVAAMGVGLLTFARALRRLFERWREKTLAVLVGLMAGSLRKLWPFVEHAPDGRETLSWPVADDPALLSATVLFLAGVGAVLGLEAAGRRSRSCPRQDSNLGPTA